MSTIEEDVNRLKNDNMITRQMVSDLDQQASMAYERMNVLEYEHNKMEANLTTLQNDTKRYMNIISVFQERMIQYTHYLEDRINKLSDIKPILIAGNKEAKTDESNIP